MIRAIFIWVFLSLAVVQSSASQVSFFMDIWRYQDFRAGTYIGTKAEIQLSIDGTTVKYRLDKDSMFRASVHVSLEIQKDNEATVFRNSFNLLSQQYEDTSLRLRRIKPYLWTQENPPILEPGNYILTAVVRDNHRNNGPSTLVKRYFTIYPIAAEKFAFSDLRYVLLSKPKEDYKSDKDLTRSSLFKRFVPLITNQNYINRDELIFYIELYNPNLLLPSGLKTNKVRARIFQDEKVLTAMGVFERTLRLQEFFAIFSGKFDINQLPSGSYSIQIELIDNQNNDNKILSKVQYPFSITNSRRDPGFDTYVAERNYRSDIFGSYNEEQLNKYLRTLGPISTEQERRFVEALITGTTSEEKETRFFFRIFEIFQEILGERDPDRTRINQKRNFLYSFWEKRIGNEDQSVTSLWKSHLTKLKYADLHFNGWQSDRGRIILKYGIPNNVEWHKEEPFFKPYLIWKYDVLDQQNDVDFIFYDREENGYYFLLHSEKYGELNNKSWEEELIKDNSMPSRGL